ncbi:uncharacterized protein EAF02_008539 [Botrytis sinoallii]|uniref:uncharacterized protein n=1 Tax=Botrytis sinoallii TaxID=1463999 RepID=UPI001901077F|nr:uncharacterized protein EAF02_008539 [Botrytis sinoallii]KAF7874562.1 hypothetical protein EAF02_008539 [Botrytis sinoallii]
MANRKPPSSIATSSSAKTAEKEDTHSESDQRILEAIRQPSTTTRPITIVGTAISSATTSNTSLSATPSATPSATKAEEKENSSKSDPRLLEASSTLIARESEGQDQNQYGGGGDEYMQMQVVESARNATHVAPEVGNFASENLLSSSSSSTMMVATASFTSASISHSDLSSTSRKTMTTILSASISALDIRNSESDSDRSSQTGLLTAGSVPPAQFLPNESDLSIRGGRVAGGSLGMMFAVIDRPRSSQVSNTSNRLPLIVDRIITFADGRSQANLREAILGPPQEPREGYSDTEEEENMDSTSDSSSSSETDEEDDEKSETSSSDYDCPGSGTSHRRQRTTQDRQDEKDSGSGRNHGSNPGNGSGNEDKESPDQSDIVTRSAQEANSKSKEILSILEADNNVKELHADRWGLNLLGGKGQEKRQRRDNTTSDFFGGGFRSLGFGIAAQTSNGKRRKIGEKGEKKEKDVDMDDNDDVDDDADDEDSGFDMDDEGSVSNVLFYSFKGLVKNWDRLECSRRYRV